MSFSTYGKRNLGLPSQIRCSVGNEMRSKDDFTANQLKKLADMLAKGQRIQPDKGVISCRVHCGPPQDEIQCKGPCGMYKHVSEFSKNSRKAGHRRWCLKCMEWSESSEGHIPLPASNNPRTQAERYLPAENGRQLNYSEEEAKSVITEVNASGSSVLEDDNANGSDPGFSILGSSRGSGNGMFGQSSYGCVDEAGDESAVARAPHHHLPNMPFGDYRDSTAFQSASAPSNMSTATSTVAMTTEKKPGANAIPYNAWDQNGRVVIRHHEPTVASSTVSTAATSEVSTSKGGWAKCASRRQPVREPSYLLYEDPDDIQATFSDGDSDDTM